MKGKDVIDRLKKKFSVSTDLALADRIGASVPGIQVWKRRRSVTTLQVARLVFGAEKAGAKHLQETAIRPIAEFFSIEKCKTRQGANYELFSANTTNASRHPYLDGLRNELKMSHGLYIFFDSRGQAIYVGKARGQTLWKEMNLTFNRERGAVQKIKRVNHPTRKQSYRTSEEKARRIVEVEVPIHELARYFSAYLVADGMINTLEAMLVRSFANNLLNKRMEQFTQRNRKT
jgi:hypothetical protein